MFIYAFLFYSDQEKKKRRPGAGTPGTPNHPTAPTAQSREPKRRMDKMKFTTQDNLYELSGRARIRAMVHPRQRVGLIEAGKLIGLSYCQIHRRIQLGKLTLRVQKDEFNQMFVTVDDLAAYLYPDEQSSPPHLPTSPPVSPKRPGRPRKSATSDGPKGGAR